MPARTGRTTYVPGRGATTRSKSGKAKTYTGKGPAPAGTKKVAEPSYSEVPTVTVTSSGATASGFGRKQAARRAMRAQEKRAKRIVRLVTSEPKTRSPKPTPPAKYDAPDLPSAVESVSSGVERAKSALTDAAKAAVKLPDQKITRSYGKPTLGTPKLKEVVKADKEGRLSGKHKGKVVATPRARKAQKQLRRARKRYAKKAKPRISGLLNEEQERFAETLSKETGLPPKLAGDWTLKESGASSAGVGGEAGEQNQLGVGYPAHPTSFSQSGYFNNTTPEKAAKATAHWMEGKLGAEYDYQAAPSIQQIPKLAKAGASDAELRAYIAGPSAWGTGEIPNSPQVKATTGKAGPKVTARLKRAKKQAKRLGIEPNAEKKAAAAAAGPSRIPSVVYIGKQAEKKFGLSVGENPAFGGVAPVHVSDSYHYRTDSKGRGEAIDVSGDPEKMMAFDHWVAQRWGKGVTELFYDPGISIKEGAEIGAIGGHGDHVHVAVAMPGEKVAGGMATSGYSGPVVGAGGALFVGYGSTTSAAVASSERARKAAAKGQAKQTSPFQKYWQTVRTLKKLTLPKSSAAPSTDVLDSLERKYGKAAA